MLKVGLTGGIGAGKSAVAARLVTLGAVLIDADVLARDVVAPGSDGLAEVIAAFGEEMLRSDGSLDRPALGARVFGDQAARRVLESIIHPRVRARTAALTAAAPPDAIVVNDVPLLVETGLAATYHLVVVVTAAEDSRVDRLVRARGMRQSDAYARIRAQVDDARRRAAGDVVLTNDSTLSALEMAVDGLWRSRLVPFEANLRAGRPAAAPPLPIIAEPDPDWKVQAERLMARFAACAGDRMLRIDHIGPTAVPGMSARNHIELQAVVADLATADRLADAARAAGFVRADRAEGGGRAERGDGTPAGCAPTERQVAGADPGRPVTVYLRPVTDQTWRDALSLRDRLRGRRAPAGGDPV